MSSDSTRAELRRAYAGWERRQRALVPSKASLIDRRDALLSRIERDFADVTRAGGMSISEADAADGGFVFLDREEARARDTDRHWSEIDLLEKDPGGSALSFMDAIGFRYHIPAYMTLALRSGYWSVGPTLDANCIDTAVRHLARLGESMSRADRQPKTKRDRAEVDTVRRFLRVMDEAQLGCCARFLLFDSLAGGFDPTANPAGPLWWTERLEGRERAEMMRMWTDL